MKQIFRIAPTPSGYLHIGNAMSFVYTAQLANAAHGNLLLRIDDIDFERTRPEYLQDIFDTLRFLNIKPIGPTTLAEHVQQYAQKLRMEMYKKTLQQLINTGLVYACTCSRKTLEQDNGNCICNGATVNSHDSHTALRIKVLEGTVIEFTDKIKGPVKINLHQQTKNFVLWRKEDIPAYQLTSICDDVLYGITDVVRGEDLLPSTAMQLYLAGLLQYDNFLSCTFYHHPVIVNNAGEKLSKSAGSVSIQDMRKQKTAPEIMTMIDDMLKAHKLV